MNIQTRKMINAIFKGIINIRYSNSISLSSLQLLAASAFIDPEARVVNPVSQQISQKNLQLPQETPGAPGAYTSSPKAQKTGKYM